MGARFESATALTYTHIKYKLYHFKKIEEVMQKTARIGKKIYVDAATKAFISRAFKCSLQAVCLALNFKRDSENARRIRVLALKRGGTLVGATVPEIDTTHEEVERTMTHTLGERVKLVADKESGDVSLWVDGRLQESRRFADIAEFMRFQNEVQLMAAAL